MNIKDNVKLPSEWAKVADKSLEAVKSAGKFIERIVGPASEDVGAILAESPCVKV